VCCQFFLQIFFCQKRGCRNQERLKNTAINCLKPDNRHTFALFHFEKMWIECVLSNAIAKRLGWHLFIALSRIKSGNRCQIHQRFTYEFFVRIFWQSQNVTRKTKFVRKICAFNVDEIDGRWCKVWAIEETLTEGESPV